MLWWTLEIKVVRILVRLLQHRLSATVTGRPAPMWFVPLKTMLEAQPVLPS